MSKRVESICHSAIHGLEIIQHNVDSMMEFMTFAVVHGVLIKGVKVLIKLLYVPMAYGVAILYSVYKVIDALFLHNREKKKSIVDPKKHCNFVNKSYGDAFMEWFKSSDAISKTIQDKGIRS